MTTKHIFTNIIQQSGIKHTAQNVATTLTSLVAAWDNLGLGPLTQELLSGNSQTSDNCRSCKGLKTYSTGETFIQDYLLDQSGGIAVGGLTLSRERMRDLIQLPIPEKVKAFEDEFQKYRMLSQSGQLNSPFVKIQEGKVVILQDKLEQHLKSLEKHISNEEDIALFEDLEQFIALTASINRRLTAKGLQRIILNRDAKKTNAVVSINEGDLSDTSLSLNTALLSSYLK